MTQAMNLANFSNSLDSSGGVPPTQLNSVVPLSKGGTNASTAAAARTSLGSTTVGDAVFIAANAAAAQSAIGVVVGTNVPSPTGTGASGTWAINISGNAATATTATSATTASGVSGVVAVANGGTGTSSGIPTNVQQFDSSGTWTKPTGGQSAAWIQCWGGGANGNGSNAGGGGGGYSAVVVPFGNLASSVSVTVGGVAGTSSVPFSSGYGPFNSVEARGGVGTIGGKGITMNGSNAAADAGGAAGGFPWGGAGGNFNVASGFPGGGGGSVGSSGSGGRVIITSF
jgi:hypothetical protein